MRDDDIRELLEQAAAELMMPRFQRLKHGDVEEKSPGEVVTIVDREVEERLARALPQLLPGSRVVGEEACAARPALLDDLAQGNVWLVDPLDGTGNIAGGSDFALMVALLRAGETVGAWMLLPASGVLFRAERGGGAWRNGERLRVLSGGQLQRGIVKTRFLPEAVKSRVQANTISLQEVQIGANCTAVDYPDLIAGRSDFALYWRTFPWDHAPGVLLLEEAGGTSLRLDGAPYRATDQSEGLLAARNAPTWQASREIIGI
jgi:fructose-1,6-bisphosphatase/inositol monophosphatase family enzyme